MTILPMPPKMIVELVTILGAPVCLAELPCDVAPPALRHDDQVFVLDLATICRKRPRYCLITSIIPTRCYKHG